MSKRLFVDTNVFVASITDEPGRGAVATDLLNGDFDFYTSLLNLMELRTVLAKKKQVEQQEVAEVLREITDAVDIVVPEGSDVVTANELQQETLLYPMDCLILAVADDQDSELVTFDAELLDAGAIDPSNLPE